MRGMVQQILYKPEIPDVLGSKVCSESFCDGFASVTCEGGQSAPAQPGRLPPGARCRQNSDCDNAICLLGVCAKP
jgi:hypothetical protein